MMLLSPLILIKLAFVVSLAGAVAFVAVFEPDWAIDPLRDAAERVLEAVGAGLVHIVLWVVAIAGLLRWRRSLLRRHWRYVAGSIALVAGIQGGLSFFDATLPLIDERPLGGDVGDRIQGTNTFLAYVRVGALAAVAFAIFAPALSLRALRATGRSSQRASIASVRACRAAPLHKTFWRWSVAAAQRSVVLFRRMRGTQPAVEDQALGQRVGDFLSSTHRSATSTRSPDTDNDSGLPPFVERTMPPDTEQIALPRTEPTPITPTEGPFIGREEPGVDDEPIETDVADVREEPEEPPLARAQAVKPPTRGRSATATKSAWVMPSITLLAPPVVGDGVDDEHWATANLIEETLAQHGVEVSVSEIRPGPSVTMFGLVPGWNRRARPGRPAPGTDESAKATDFIGEARNRVKVDSILAREKDLTLALAAPSLRIQAPVPGEPLVGVEVPNKSSMLVTMRSVMETDEYRAMLAEDGLPVALGLASAGEPVAIDLLKMPHLLIAGATGSGKSVCINSIICSLIAHQSPSKVVLLLVDPKRVELTPYNGIPHLVTPVVTDPDRVVRLLRGAIEEMSRRYKRLEEAGVRNIQSYNRSPKATEHMPYFVICIDELADLMMTASVEVEQGICRLAQLGRATGIHMVVATQRPSVDVVTGLIKANFPSRIAFAVASQVDSRTIIDSVGADRLIGRGDMLFLSAASPKPRRVQGVLVTQDETDALAAHWQAHPPMDLPLLPLEEMARAAEEASANREAQVEFGENDSLYDRAIQVAAASGQLSTSLLQRKLRIGYPRAARLMDQLEDEGIVGSNVEPGKPREVLRLPNDN